MSRPVHSTQLTQEGGGGARPCIVQQPACASPESGTHDEHLAKVGLQGQLRQAVAQGRQLPAPHVTPDCLACAAATRHGCCLLRCAPLPDCAQVLQPRQAVHTRACRSPSQSRGMYGRAGAAS
jgi:hypothetical protein